jgi:adenylyl-sulfate kinase
MSRALVLWFTGLSGAGKSTIAERVKANLEQRGRRVLVLDGDDVRARFHRHLGFTPEDIRENNRLIAELCRESLEEADVSLVPVIAPFAEARAAARDTIGDAFHEIYVRAGLDTVRGRDTKGLYRKASVGELQLMIGVDERVPFEPPAAPAIVLDTERETPEASARRLLDYVDARLPNAS